MKPIALFAGLAVTAVQMLAQEPAPTVAVRIDSARHEAVITVGPLSIPGATTYSHHFAPAPAPFVWPATGFIQGFRIDLVDSTGRVQPRAMLHHAGVTNLDRRQLAYPLAERTFAAGVETETVTLPGSMGVPVSQGHRMLLYYALTNPASEQVDNLTLRITLPWQPEGRGQPRAVMPMYFDARPMIAAQGTFDAPPGRSVTSAEFVLPSSGHLRYLGGHLHDFGVELRLEDAESNSVLVRLAADRDADGKVRSVERTSFYTKRNGLPLQANHRYRIVAVYDNPTCAVAAGSMGILVALFTPDDIAKWPAVDTTHADYQKDVAWLREVGGSDEAHEHGEAQHSGAASNSCAALVHPRAPVE